MNKLSRKFVWLGISAAIGVLAIPLNGASAAATEISRIDPEAVVCGGTSRLGDEPFERSLFSWGPRKLPCEDGSLAHDADGKQLWTFGAPMFDQAFLIPWLELTDEEKESWASGRTRILYDSNMRLLKSDFPTKFPSRPVEQDTLSGKLQTKLTLGQLDLLKQSEFKNARDFRLKVRMQPYENPKSPGYFREVPVKSLEILGREFQAGADGIVEGEIDLNQLMDVNGTLDMTVNYDKAKIENLLVVRNSSKNPMTNLPPGVEQADGRNTGEHSLYRVDTAAGNYSYELLRTWLTEQGGSRAEEIFYPFSPQMITMTVVAQKVTAHTEAKGSGEVQFLEPASSTPPSNTPETPPPSSETTTPDSPGPSQRRLPDTGASIGRLVIWAGALIVSGTGLIILIRGKGGTLDST